MTATSPTPCSNSPMVYSSTLGGLVLINTGNFPSFLNYSVQTWLFSGGNWSLIAAGLANNPVPRVNCGAAIDGAGNVIMGFGKGAPETGYMDDLNQFNTTTRTWSQLVANDGYYVNGPNIRENASMATLTGQIVMWGGNDAHFRYNQTYTLATGATTWSLANTPVQPSIRSGHGFASNGTTTAMLTHGANSSFGLNDTWLFSGGAWTNVVPGYAAGSPSVRINMALAWSPVSSTFLMFGGSTPGTSNLLNELWSFDPVALTWTNLMPTNSPSRRQGASMFYNTTSSQMILVGGVDSQNRPLSDTWSYVSGSNTWVQL